MTPEFSVMDNLVRRVVSLAGKLVSPGLPRSMIACAPSVKPFSRGGAVSSRALIRIQRPLLYLDAGATASAPIAPRLSACLMLPREAARRFRGGHPVIGRAVAVMPDQRDGAGADPLRPRDRAQSGLGTSLRPKSFVMASVCRALAESRAASKPQAQSRPRARALPAGQAPRLRENDPRVSLTELSSTPASQFHLRPLFRWPSAHPIAYHRGSAPPARPNSSPAPAGCGSGRRRRLFGPDRLSHAFRSITRPPQQWVTSRH